MLDDCFFQLNNFPDLEDLVCEAGINAVFPNLPKEETPENHVPQSIGSRSRFFKTKFCQDLSQQFGEIKTNFIKNGPMSTYDWHRDIDRKVAINFLLRPAPNSLVLFRDKEYGVDRMRYNIKACEYTPKKPVIFNTTIQHTVINYNDQPRYILSLIFPMEVTYFDVKDFLTSYPIPSGYIN
jgi:hypothetical protein